MHRAAQALSGKHDFSSFQTSGSPRKSNVRTIFEISVRRMKAEAGKGRGENETGEASRAVLGPGVGQKTESGVQRAEYGKQKADRVEEQSRAVSARPDDFRCDFFLPASSAGDWIVVEVEADGFLYNMVRSIVGTLVEVGRGAEPENWVAEVLRRQDRRRAGRNAPPQGLFLVGVVYP